MLKISVLLAALIAQIAGASTDLDEGTRRVTAFLDSTDIARIRTYCVPGKDDCRTLVQRRYKVTGKLSKSFYDIFSSRTRKVESVCYLLFNEETGRHDVYSDLTPDGQVKIDQILPQNRGLEVTFDAGEYPTVTNLILIQLGTTAGLKGTMSFRANASYVRGNLIQLSNPDELGEERRVDYSVVPSELSR